MMALDKSAREVKSKSRTASETVVSGSAINRSVVSDRRKNRAPTKGDGFISASQGPIHRLSILSPDVAVGVHMSRCPRDDLSAVRKHSRQVRSFPARYALVDLLLSKGRWRVDSKGSDIPNIAQ